MAFLGPLISAGLSAALPALTQGAGELIGDVARGISAGEPIGLDLLGNALKKGAGTALKGFLSGSGSPLRMVAPSPVSAANARPVMGPGATAAAPGAAPGAAPISVPGAELPPGKRPAWMNPKHPAHARMMAESPEARAERHRREDIRKTMPEHVFNQLEGMSMAEEAAFIDAYAAKKAAREAKKAAKEVPRPKRFKEYYADEKRKSGHR